MCTRASIRLLSRGAGVIFIVLLLACGLTGCATSEGAGPADGTIERPDHQLRVANARIESDPDSLSATAYFVILNKSTQARTIVGATGACCSAIRLERAVLRDGRMASESLAEMEIPAGGAVAFVPRGLSLELDLEAPLAAGDAVSLELQLANAKPLRFEATLATD